MEQLQKIGAVPFDINVLQSVYPGCKQITDKARRLEADGRIIRLKKGLYVANANGGELSRELVANHLYGPSYVSMSWALRWYGLIPERVNLIQSVTTKHSRDFSNALGTFHYQNCATDYFQIGITIKGETDCRYLIASPEKALCDYICFNKVTLRFMKDVRIFLEEDIRFDTEAIRDLDLRIIEQCSALGRKSGSLSALLNYLKLNRNKNIYE